MKCPLLVVEDIREHDNQLTDVSDCLEADCAWYDRDNTQCSIRSLCGTLDEINNSMHDIAKRMTLPRQI